MAPWWPTEEFSELPSGQLENFACILEAPRDSSENPNFHQKVNQMATEKNKVKSSCPAHIRQASSQQTPSKGHRCKGGGTGTPLGPLRLQPWSLCPLVSPIAHLGEVTDFGSPWPWFAKLVRGRRKSQERQSLRVGTKFWMMLVGKKATPYIGRKRKFPFRFSPWWLKKRHPLTRTY